MWFIPLQHTGKFDWYIQQLTFKLHSCFERPREQDSKWDFNNRFINFIKLFFIIWKNTAGQNQICHMDKSHFDLIIIRILSICSSYQQKSASRNALKFLAKNGFKAKRILYWTDNLILHPSPFLYNPSSP